MSDYNIDDILAEIDRKRDPSDTQRSSDSSVSITEIIGGNELEQAMRSSGIKRRTEADIASEEEDEQREAKRRAEEIAIAAERRKHKAAMKQAEDQRRREEQERVKAEAEARRRDREAQKAAEEEERRRIEAERAAEEERLRKLEAAAKKLEDELMDVPPEAESEDTDDSPAHSGFTAELASPEEAARLFVTEEHEVVRPEGEYVESQSEYVQPYVKPAVSGEDDDIIFHTRGDLVTTNTQQIRKQQRIDEINRALLEADMAAESPDELLDSINPMESRAKAAEEIKSAETVIGDTLAVAGNDLKRLSGGEERVKEYAPAVSRKKNKGVEGVLQQPVATVRGEEDDVKEYSSVKERRSNDALVASLNKKLKEQREKSIEAERTVTLTNITDPAQLPPHALNIDYEKQLIDTGVIAGRDPVQAIREADELAARKKRRIANFMLEDIDDEVESAGEDEELYDDEEEEVIDLDDENVIVDRLRRASKGLIGRLMLLVVLLMAALIAGVVFRLNAEGIPILSALCNKFNVEKFLVTNLTLGILSFGACSSVITNGLSRLVKLKPDGDTLCAFAHCGAIIAIIIYLTEPSMLVTDNAHLYLIVSLGTLCFNTVAKLCTVKAAQNNFAFISGDRGKYFVECLSDDGADKLARGTGIGIPMVASMRKTELLCDFIISTYCEDVSDRVARWLTPVVLVAGIGGGLMTYFMSVSNYVWENVALGATTASAVFAVGATFSGSLIVMLPMLIASKTLTAKSASVLGYSAVEDVNETSAILVEAKSLFPVNSVKVNNIWDYNKNGSKGTQHIQIDDAIIYAASLAVSADSVLADAFFNMLNYKSALLKQVSNCVYESNLGVMGWIGSRRVLLGNRDHMKSHGVAVPEAKKEAAVNKNNDEVVYLAVGGEVCMLFFVQLTANSQVKRHVEKLAKNGVSLIIKTVDGMITEGVIGELFDIGSESVRIIPYEAHDEFEERTKYVSKGSAAVSCDGTFSSFAAAINGSKDIYKKVKLGCAMQIAGVALGILLVFIFAFFGNYSIAGTFDPNSTVSPYFSTEGFNYFDMLNAFYIAVYNLGWLALTVIAQSVIRIKP